MGSPATTQSPLAALVERLAASLQRNRWLEVLVVSGASAVMFGTLMKLTLVLLFGNGIAVCWPMVGLTAAVMLRVDRRHWLALLAGTSIAHIYLERSYPFGEMAVDTVCDGFEIGIAALSLPAFRNMAAWMGKPNLLLRFIAFPVVLGPLLTAIPVGLIFARVQHQPFFYKAAQWFFADALGVVLWLPLGLVLLDSEAYPLFRLKGLPTTVGMMGLLLGTGLAIFESRPLPLAFLVMPILLMVALKVGFSGSVVSMNALALITGVATLHRHGPFGAVPEHYQVMALQIFLAACMLMCFPVSIIMLERDAFEHELRDAFARMEQLATRDGLTGLANRRQFDQALEEEWRRALRQKRNLGLLMIDVDCFKLYNDCYGHVAGDDCLRRIAETLATAGQRAGDLPGRYGGEEFFLLMPRTDIMGLLMVAEKIRSSIESLRIKHEANQNRVVTISIGCCSVVPRARQTAEMFVEAADRALYAAKQNGRNRVAAAEINLPEARRSTVRRRA